MRVAFITNQRSGRRKDHDALRKAIDAAAAKCEVESTIEPCDSLEKLDSMVDSALARGVDMVFAVGGDGTVHETAKRLIGTPAALGIIPTGSGNGLARHLGIPMDPAAAVELLTTGKIVDIDTADVNGHPFFGVAGVGFDAVVAHRFASSTSRGLETYVVEAGRALFAFSPEHYRVSIDGEELETQAFLIAIANSKQWGNEAKVAPLASVRDGLLDVSILVRPPLGNAPSMLWKLFEGTLEDSSQLKLRRGAVVAIERESEGPAHLDGEAVILPARLIFTVKPLSLRVLVSGDREI
ncbi:MAG: diacylglycerol/lipid kinase family protein [Thermoanaerobaculia bacterium]